jgi:hypothetical protein
MGPSLIYLLADAARQAARHDPSQIPRQGGRRTMTIVSTARERQQSIAGHVYTLPVVQELARQDHTPSSYEATSPSTAGESARDRHERQRARVQASLLLSRRHDSPTHRR